MNQYFAISSEKQQCLADVINLLGVVLIRPSGGRSVLIYLESTYGPFPMASYIPDGQTSRGSGLSKYHIRYAASGWADGPSTVRRADQNSG